MLKTQKLKKEKQRSFEDFTFMGSILFTSVGYDILETKSSKKWPYNLFRGYFVLCLVTNCYSVFFVTLRFLQFESDGADASRMMRHALHFFYMLCAEVKMANFLYYRNRLRLLNDNLRNLYPSEDGKRRRYDVNRYYLSGTTRYVLSFYYLVMSLMMVAPLLQSYLMYFLQGEGAKFAYLRIFPTRLSFRSDTPWGYAVTYIVDFTYSHLIVNFTLGTDLWMINVTRQICMHFAHLAKDLSSYSPSRETEAKDCAFLVRFVKSHQHILDLHNEVDTIFGLVLASNLLTTASLLCCVAFYTLVQGFNMDGMSYMMVFLSIAGLFLMVSSHGQMLIDGSGKISEAAYQQNWYDGSVLYRKYLMFILIRGQRPSRISAWGIVIISLDTFKILMSITYRFFAVMRQTVGK
ncbi:hypothetical protein KR009_002181 [Drosophila setifemur]|nr:hypothetical protein KR009_002181 [Drosophila setifemur]